MTIRPALAFRQGLRLFKATAFLALLFLLVIGGSVSPSHAEGRWALVVGIGEYRNPAVSNLKNTVNDSRTIAAAMRNMGFQVYYLENATRAEIDAGIDKIGAENAGAESGLVFFAGHGLQVGGTNYLLPADVAPNLSDFINEQGINVSEMIGRLRDTGVGSLVVVLDSCRNSPFGEDSAFGTGLALVDAPENTIIAYSTAPGAVAVDGTGANSPFTAALASALAGPEQDMRDVLRYVRARVRVATGGQQTPWYIDNSREPIVLSPRKPVELPPELLSEVEGGISLASTAWKTIQNSADPRDFVEFARLHPDDQLAGVALRQVTLLTVEAEGPPDFPLMDLGLPDPNPEVPGALSAIITACDILATGIGDVMALVEPVPHDLVNIPAALRACVDAVSNDPDNSRLLALLARVLKLDQRFDEALYYYERAAELGNPSAYGGLSDMHRYGLGTPEDKVKSAEMARKGAMMGAPPLRLLLGMHYREGWGVPQSYNEARRWMEIAAMRGDSSALTALGDLYVRGQGMPEDPATAVSYYRKAAALGKTDAMNNLGLAYLRGTGVPKDPQQGIWWLSRASDEGNPYAAFHLGRVFMTGWGVDENPEQALAYFRLSAQRNFLGAYVQIGDALQAGKGAEVDLPQAYASYVIAIEAAKERDTIAASKELAEAQEKLDELAKRLSEAEVSKGREIAQNWIDQYGLLDFNLVHE